MFQIRKPAAQATRRVSVNGVTDLKRRDNSLTTALRQGFVRAVLHGDDVCTAGGITARSPSPVLDLCRKLLAAGVPDQPLYAFRGDTLALIVHSISKAARLEVAEGLGFRPYRRASPAPLAAPNAPARIRHRKGGARA